MISTSEGLEKIPIKMNNQSKSNSTKVVMDKKTTIEPMKRKHVDANNQCPTREKKIFHGKETMKSIFRNIESMIEVEEIEKNLSNMTDIESWCFEKMRELIQEEKSNSGRQKN